VKIEVTVHVSMFPQHAHGEAAVGRWEITDQIVTAGGNPLHHVVEVDTAIAELAQRTYHAIAARYGTPEHAVNRQAGHPGAAQAAAAAGDRDLSGDPYAIPANRIPAGQ
jgi:hypothetical protein